MRILLVHQNFPGQFKHLAPALARDPANEVTAFTMNAFEGYPGIQVVKYSPARGSTQGIHPWLMDMESKVIRGEAAFRAALAMKQRGYEPEVIVAHPGWGESLFLKEVWPNAKLGIYCEFYYMSHNGDLDFDPEFQTGDAAAPCRIDVKNINNLMHFRVADAGISPTQWQRSTFPEPFRSKISVIHEGIDTDYLAPDPSVEITLNGTLKLGCKDEIITFINRNLEPYRGYHVFIRSLPELLKRRPNARVVIIGSENNGYGAAAPEGKNWRDIFFAEVADKIDRSRVHFLGKVEYKLYIALMQASTVHVYLTYPFVLSWSLLEAMSMGCAIVASNTQPLHEAIVDGETGRLVDFFDQAALVDAVCALAADPAERARLGANARAFAKATYDLKTVCLPQQIAWVRSLQDC